VKRDEALSLNCHDQRLCDLGGTAHNHCVCGLPTLESAELCGLCRAEGLQPAAAVDSPRADLIWDGRGVALACRGYGREGGQASGLSSTARGGFLSVSGEFW
jgi:hypothetical protein